MTYGKAPEGDPQTIGRHAWTLYSSGASEEVLGRFLKEHVRREDVVVATKVQGVMREGPNGKGLSRKEIVFELEQSLRRLGMEYVDLYQIHRWDPETPIEETLEPLHDAVKAGKVRYIGASSMFSWQVCEGAVSGGPAWVDQVCVDTEPLQPAVPGGGAGDDGAVRGGADRGVAVRLIRGELEGCVTGIPGGDHGRELGEGDWSGSVSAGKGGEPQADECEVLQELAGCARWRVRRGPVPDELRAQKRGSGDSNLSAGQGRKLATRGLLHQVEGLTFTRRNGSSGTADVAIDGAQFIAC